MIIGDATWHHRLREAADNVLQRSHTTPMMSACR
jgi:hypothetical protein